MALQLSVTLDSGIIVPNAYHRITRWSGGTSKDDVVVYVSTYKDAESRKEDKKPVLVRQINIPYDATARGETLANLYAGVKALQEFSGAGDV